mmetsp:Transcript_10681/g.12212  ORF Transcript_10681/g.12212 Transcript_10681/m.12212 type:complete len:133 (-) Transcript_10681:236-634(-)
MNDVTKISRLACDKFLNGWGFNAALRVRRLGRKTENVVDKLVSLLFKIKFYGRMSHEVMRRCDSAASLGRSSNKLNRAYLRACTGNYGVIDNLTFSYYSAVHRLVVNCFQRHQEGNRFCVPIPVGTNWYAPP